MNNKKVALTGLLLGLFLVAAIAGGSRMSTPSAGTHEALHVAQAPKISAPPQEFQRLDTNEDGVIDRTEANAIMELGKEFSDLTDGDSLSRDQYLSWAAQNDDPTRE